MNSFTHKVYFIKLDIAWHCPGNIVYYIYYSLSKTSIPPQNCFLNHLTTQHKIHGHITGVITIGSKKLIKMPQLCANFSSLMAILET